MPTEDLYTPSSDWCKNPQYWHSDDNESTEQEVSVLVAAFVTALQPEFVLETGTAFGATTKLIGQALQKNGHGTCLSIEWDGNRCDIAKEVCHGLPVQIWGGHSLQYFEQEGYGFDQLIDFAWLDSGLYRGPEIRYYYPYFSEGAIVGVHDVGPQHAEVRRQILELQDEKLIAPIFLRTPRGVTFCQILN